MAFAAAGERARAGASLRRIAALAEMEARKIRHDPVELVARAAQPALWLLLFGQVLARARILDPGTPYMAFLTPGILAQSVLFIAIFYGVAVIWERDLGLVHKLVASPAPRSVLVLGKALASGLRALSQVAIIYLLALALGVGLVLAPLNVLGVVLVALLGAACFSTLSLIVAAIVETRERFLGIGQLLTMPLFFASNALYPVELMPSWLQAVARVNPLTYQVDALRALMLPGFSAANLALDVGVLVGFLALLVAVGARVYPRLAR
jgi:ABC-2 type transport system permease protein